MQLITRLIDLLPKLYSKSGAAPLEDGTFIARCNIFRFIYGLNQLRTRTQIRPEGDGNRESSITSDDTHTSSPSADGTSVSYPTYSAPKKLADLEPVLSGDSDDTSEAEDLSHVALANHMGQLSIATLQERFYGQSR